MNVQGTKLLTLKRALMLLIEECKAGSEYNEHDVIELQQAIDLLHAVNFNIEKEGVEA